MPANDEAYQLAYMVAVWIERHITIGSGRRFLTVPTKFFRLKDSGLILEDLEDVIRALKTGNLVVE